MEIPSFRLTSTIGLRDQTTDKSWVSRGKGRKVGTKVDQYKKVYMDSIDRLWYLGFTLNPYAYYVCRKVTWPRECYITYEVPYIRPLAGTAIFASFIVVATLLQKIYPGYLLSSLVSSQHCCGRKR